MKGANGCKKKQRSKWIFINQTNSKWMKCKMKSENKWENNHEKWERKNIRRRRSRKRREKNCRNSIKWEWIPDSNAIAFALTKHEVETRFCFFSLLFPFFIIEMKNLDVISFSQWFSFQYIYVMKAFPIQIRDIFDMRKNKLMKLLWFLHNFANWILMYQLHHIA